MDIVLLVLGLLLFVVLIVLHELGHALVARRNGVEVEEFGIGFPPRAWGKKLKNDVFFSLNWLPLGGFVKLKGETDSARGTGTYGGASLWVKTKILLAGVVANWATAAIIFTVLALFGMPKVLPNQFAVEADNHVTVAAVRAALVAEDSPAEKAGIAAGDAIHSVAGQNVTGSAQFAELTKANAGKTVQVLYEHQGQRQTANVALNQNNDQGGYIGVGAVDQTQQRATWSAPLVGIGVTAQFTYETLKGLALTVAQVFTAQFSEAGQNVAGPVGIFTILQDSSTLGIVPVLFLIGIISLSLAVINVLPIPALDGGRLFVTLLFRALKKPLTKEREEAIQAAGFIALMALIVLITIVDVNRFF